MSSTVLSAEQRKGVRAAVLVVILVLVLFVTIQAAGQSIAQFGSEPLSVGYAMVVYTPVIALCVLAYRRLG